MTVISLKDNYEYETVKILDQQSKSLCDMVLKESIEYNARGTEY